MDSGKSKRRPILVVMEDPEELSAMELALQRAGYSTVLAMNPQHALRELGTIPASPAGVMLDAGIPRPALASLVAAIASSPSFARVPILFIKQDPRSRHLH